MAGEGQPGGFADSGEKPQVLALRQAQGENDISVMEGFVAELGGAEEF
jgi:hypothetical protein